MDNYEKIRRNPYRRISSFVYLNCYSWRVGVVGEMNNPIDEIRTLYRDTLEEFKANAGFEDQQYWQGRKDAMRLCLALLLPETDLKFTTETSMNYIPVDRDLVNGLLEDAVYNAAAIVYELDVDRVDSRTVNNLTKFVKQYDHLAKQGKFPTIKDHCLR